MTEKQQDITRRGVLAGAGAGAAALGTVALGSTEAAAHDWRHEADIVVVGSGIGAATAAVTARLNGDSVILIDKSPFFGGTSAKTAGVLWIPNNFTLREKGIEDSRQDCLKYVARFSYPEFYDPNSPTLGLSAGEYALLGAFYDNASKAIDELRAAGVLKVAEWRMFHLDRSATDYLADVPENKVPTGRTLGVIGKNGKLGLGNEMMQQMEAGVGKLGTTVLLGHAAVGVIQNKAGRVIGVEAEHEGKPVFLRAAKGVIFATGGYVHDPDSVARFQTNRLYGACAIPMATGDFINIATAAGARLGNLSGAWRTQVVLEGALRSSKLAGGVFFPPGDSSFQVNKYGLRVVDENRNYNDRTQVHGVYDPSRAEYPNQVLFMVYDQRTAEAFAGVYPLPAEPAGADYVLSAGTLGGLAEKIEARLGEISAGTGELRLESSFVKNLKATVERFNGFARAGKDEDFGRGGFAYDREWHPAFSPMKSGTKWPTNKHPNITMHPLRGEGPYYAILLSAGALDTNGGPVIDAKARIMDAQDHPIPSLYGAGNCIASPSRDAYWGAGCPLGLSCTFGYIAANSAHQEPRWGAS